MPTYKMMMRHGRTDIEMVASGAWVKVGRKHFRHVSGVEVRYDSNAWLWKVSGGPWDRYGFEVLHGARSAVEYHHNRRS